jgi:hypothetical protein
VQAYAHRHTFSQYYWEDESSSDSESEMDSEEELDAEEGTNSREGMGSKEGMDSKGRTDSKGGGHSDAENWVQPDGFYQRGGEWLLNRCVRVYWEGEGKWFQGIVTSFDERPDAVDSHGSVGPVHTIVYEDEVVVENLATVAWQFALLMKGLQV